MPPMDRERHEELLNKLNDPNLEHSERTDILQELRQDYASVHDEFMELSETTDRLKKENEDLVISNSKLFRQIGVQDDPQLKEKEEQKTFSESVTIEDLEKQSGVN